MIYKYEMACREAGLNEEQIKEIDRVFDADKKKLKRKKNAQEEENKKNGFGIYSFSEMGGQDKEDDFDAPDPNVDIEADMILKWEIQRVRDLLADMEEPDRVLLLAYTSGVHGAKGEAAKQVGLTRRKADYRVGELLAYMRSVFDE